ncbi:MAG: Holliday junction branch migration protein RuvA [Myxococcota bacterium]
MIGRLKGTIEHREADGSVIVDVQGVGYEVFLPLGAAGRLTGEAGQPVSLHIHTHVREDAMTLFGFATGEDRLAFRALLKVSSVGPKLALAILGVMNASELREAIVRHDKAAFKGISGVGRKTIERLLVDLQDKLDFAADGTTGVHLRAVPAQSGSASDTVVGALIQMGYKRSEAEAAVGSAAAQADPQQGDEAVQGLLRAALSALS